MTIESELARIGDLLEKLVAAESSKSESTTTKPARTAKATKAASATPTEAPTASSTSAEATSAESPSEKAAPAKASDGTGTLPAPSAPTSVTLTNPPTLDQVRYALTQCQARNKGDIAKPRAILEKYAKTGTLGSLAEGDRAKVIDECNAS